MDKKISDPEDVSIKASKPCAQTEKVMKKKKMEENIQEICGNYKRFNILIMRIQEEREVYKKYME